MAHLLKHVACGTDCEPCEDQAANCDGVGAGQPPSFAGSVSGGFAGNAISLSDLSPGSSRHAENISESDYAIILDPQFPGGSFSNWEGSRAGSDYAADFCTNCDPSPGITASLAIRVRCRVSDSNGDMSLAFVIDDDAIGDTSVSGLVPNSAYWIISTDIVLGNSGFFTAYTLVPRSAGQNTPPTGTHALQYKAWAFQNNAFGTGHDRGWANSTTCDPCTGSGDPPGVPTSITLSSTVDQRLLEECDSPCDDSNPDPGTGRWAWDDGLVTGGVYRASGESGKCFVATATVQSRPVDDIDIEIVGECVEARLLQFCIDDTTLSDEDIYLVDPAEANENTLYEIDGETNKCYLAAAGTVFTPTLDNIDSSDLTSVGTQCSDCPHQPLNCDDVTITQQGDSDTGPCDCADLNDDDTVGAFELFSILGAWGTSDSTTDINNDGVVDAKDFGLMLGQWGAIDCDDPGFTPPCAQSGSATLHCDAGLFSVQLNSGDRLLCAWQHPVDCTGSIVGDPYLGAAVQDDSDLEIQCRMWYNGDPTNGLGDADNYDDERVPVLALQTTDVCPSLDDLDLTVMIRRANGDIERIDYNLDFDLVEICGS